MTKKSNGRIKDKIQNASDRSALNISISTWEKSFHRYVLRIMIHEAEWYKTKG